jgi:hypothetical protein
MRRVLSSLRNEVRAWGPPVVTIGHPVRCFQICVAGLETFHENKSGQAMSPDPEHPDQKAIRLLNRQLEELKTVRTLNYRTAAGGVFQAPTRTGYGVHSDTSARCT